MDRPDCTRTVVVNLENGLHLSPASQIARLALGVPCELTIRNGTRRANARDIFEIVGLVAEFRHELILEARGDGGEQALDALVRLFETNFPTDKPPAS